LAFEPGNHVDRVIAGIVDRVEHLADSALPGNQRQTPVKGAAAGREGWEAQRSRELSVRVRDQSVPQGDAGGELALLVSGLHAEAGQHDAKIFKTIVKVSKAARLGRTSERARNLGPIRHWGVG